ncbi:MAG: hypothetical protein ACKOWD_03305 [Rhodoferax sp.]
MSDPQFIPSGRPHSVEVAEGSHVAKSKSANVGTEVRQNTRDRFAQEQEIEIDPHQIVLTTSAAAPDNTVKLPRGDTIERASKPIGSGGPAARSAKDTPPAGGQPAARERPVYDVEMQEMNFPARVIHLKVENDAVRAQLEDLQSLMGESGTTSENSK